VPTRPGLSARHNYEQYHDEQYHDDHYELDDLDDGPLVPGHGGVGLLSMLLHARAVRPRCLRFLDRPLSLGHLPLKRRREECTDYL